jgi:ribosomal protein S18 acetylase RimI-like enzyme
VGRLAHRPLEASDLASIEPWFDDPATRRWLGGREWPRRLVTLAQGPERFAVVWELAAQQVALLDLEREEDGSAAIAIVVRPGHRRTGIGRAVTRSIFSLPQIDGVERILAEVEHGNEAAERLVRAAAFEAASGSATGEEFSRWELRRPH